MSTFKLSRDKCCDLSVSPSQFELVFLQEFDTVPLNAMILSQYNRCPTRAIKRVTVPLCKEYLYLDPAMLMW